jgi:4-amino-4-deoxy-L-arabinose transferase-like glycosyltransferase
MPDERVVTGVVLVGILLLALTVRVYRLPELMVVGGDQARDALVVEQMLDTGQPVLQGPIASTGTFHRGPAYYYLLGAAYWLSGGDPIGGALLSVALDLAALVMAFVIVRAVAGSSAGLVAASLWAVAPILVLFARFQWNPQNMIFFALLAVYAALRISRGEGRWLLVLAPAWLIAWQFHEPAYLLVPMLALILLWKWRAWMKLRLVAGALALSALVVLPFLAQQLTHRFEDVRAMLAYMGAAATGGQVPTTNEHGLPSAIDRVTTALGWLPRALPSPGVVNLVLLALGVIGLGWLINRVVRQRSSDAAVLLLYSATPLMYAFWPAPLYSHYHLLIFPIPLMLAGVGFAAVARVALDLSSRLGRTRMAGVAVASAAAALVLIVGVAFVDSLAGTAAAQPAPQSWPNVLRITREVIADAKDQPFALRIKADYFPHVNWYPEWLYPFEFAGTQADPLRVDLPTYVIFDPADYAGGATYGGHVVDGVRWAAFPTPALGEQLLSDTWGFNGTGAGSLDATAAPVSIHLSAEAKHAYNDAIQSVPITGLTRYLVRYSFRTAAVAGAVSVYLQAFDANGVLLTTLPDGGGDRHEPTTALATASFIGQVPAGAATGTVIVRWTGVGDAWFTNVELRQVTTEPPW